MGINAEKSYVLLYIASSLYCLDDNFSWFIGNMMLSSCRSNLKMFFG